jgi:hypothetical protein
MSCVLRVVQLIWAGRDYPAGLDKLRPGAKRAFFAAKDETDPEKINQALQRVRSTCSSLSLGGRSVSSCTTCAARHVT